MTKDYALFAFIVMSFWVVAIAVALVVAIHPAIGHFSF